MIVAGIGCRRNATQSEIEASIIAALAACGIERSALDAIATSAEKCAEPGVLAMARAWSLPLVELSTDQLRDAVAGVRSTSSRVLALKGLPSVAETAALAAAGRGARLLCARVTSAQAACAIAATGDGFGDLT